nr:MAG TPA: hypothetical protein [Caudoviricetes sp.]
MILKNKNGGREIFPHYFFIRKEDGRGNRFNICEKYNYLKRVALAFLG